MRAAIRQEIESIEPLDDLERQTRADALRWVDSGVELCRLHPPDQPPRHLVSYFALVDGDQVLLVDHVKAELWLPTGGHVEAGEHPRDTVRREAREELGIDAVFLTDGPLFLTQSDTVGRTAGHTDVSRGYVLGGERRRELAFDRSEFYGVRWFHRGSVPLHRSDPHMARFLSKWYGG